MNTNAMLEFLLIAAMEEKKQLLQEQVIQRRRNSKEVPRTKRVAENGSHRFLPTPPKPLSFEDVLQHERSLKKAMVRDDCDQEREQKKAKFCRNFLESEPERRPTNGIVFREPNPGKNPSLDFTGKSKYNADDKGKNHYTNMPNSKPEKSEKRRKRKETSYLGNVKGRPHPLPEDVRMKIEEKARLAGEKDLKIVLVIQKVLQRSDVLRQQNRVTIPLAQIENKFLTPQQEQDLEEKIGSHYFFLTVPIIEPSGRVREVHMRRWNVGKRSVSYVLNGDWKHVVESNQLQEDQLMQLWAFWIQGRLNFAFVVLPGDESASKALAVINDHPQTGCLIRRPFDEASSSMPQPSAAAEVEVEDEVAGSSYSGSEVITATSEGEAENSRSRSEDSEPRWRFDLNMMPELE